MSGARIVGWWLALAPFVVVVTPGLASRVAAQAVPAGDDENVVIIERILVKVNGEIITQTDLELRQVEEIRRRGLEPTTNAELARVIAEVTPTVIANAVDELLMVQRGRDLGYQLSDDQFDEIVLNLVAENGLDDRESLETALLDSNGMTIGDLRTMMERQMLVSQVQQVEILRKVTMTDTEAREYYEANRDEFTEPATATIREILIAMPEGTTGFNLAAAEQARTVAETTVARLRDGEDFASLAIEVSDSPSRANGGLIGPLLVSEYSDGIQAVIRELEVGEVTDPIRTPQGYQIVMLEAQEEARTRPFEEVREDISNNVFNDRRTREYSDYLESLREEAIIEWNNELLQQAYEQHRASQVTPVIGQN